MQKSSCLKLRWPLFSPKTFDNRYRRHVILSTGLPPACMNNALTCGQIRSKTGLWYSCWMLLEGLVWRSTKCWLISVMIFSSERHSSLSVRDTFHNLLHRAPSTSITGTIFPDDATCENKLQHAGWRGEMCVDVGRGGPDPLLYTLAIHVCCCPDLYANVQLTHQRRQ